MNTAPLKGIKVVDFTNVQSGPSCTQMLAWLGAEVVKIERPGSGDATRNELQFDPDCPSYYFLQLNSDKKSLTLDAATPDGKEILTKLIKGADIFVENLHPGAMDKLGFSWRPSTPSTRAVSTAPSRASLPHRNTKTSRPMSLSHR